MKNLINEIDKLEALEELTEEVEAIGAEVRALAEFAGNDKDILQSDFFRSFVKAAELKTLELLARWKSIRAA